MALEVGQEAELEMDQADMDPGLGKVFEVAMGPNMVQEVVLDVFLVSLYPFHKSQEYKSHQYKSQQYKFQGVELKLVLGVVIPVAL